jgi:energy-coupling factor transporter ATP-binding protein EcfA2
MFARRMPRGSEWRKWDLQLHTPGTKLNDGYTKLPGGTPDWRQFCEIIHESDVAAVGITDYFSLDSYFEFVKQYSDMYPDDTKVFFPNIELRLPEVINDAGQSVNVHLIFRPDLTGQEAQKFLMALRTETTVGKARKTPTCNELAGRAEFESATVSRSSIEAAIRHTFGDHAVRQDHLLVVTSAKGDGIRPGGKGSKKRKASLADEIDKFSDAFFAGPSSRDYFLDVDRLESDDPTTPKPVFGGCDAHNFDALRTGLGKHSDASGAQQNVTWIKADPNYEGLLQTLIEPEHRVAVQPVEPDLKEPYKVISRVKFTGGSDFPAEVVFSRNLNAIIGSRSSGKSALLAFMAHAVDPEETIQQQVDASKLSRKDVGPAAGKSWQDVADITCEVEWGSTGASAGRVIYIPQNSLFELSSHPDKVTQKIAPSLFRTYPEFQHAYDHAVADITAANEDIGDAVAAWFTLADEIDTLSEDILNLGDKQAIQAERDRLQQQVDAIKQASQLTDEEIAAYQKLSESLDGKTNRLDEIVRELAQLSPYAVMADDAKEATSVPGSVQATVTVRPSGAQLPEGVAARIDELRSSAESALRNQVEEELAKSLVQTRAEQAALTAEAELLRLNNAHLIEKHKANDELNQVVGEHKKQVGFLTLIERKEVGRTKKVEAQAGEATKITESLKKREGALTKLRQAFAAESRSLDDLTFGIETEIDSEAVELVSQAVNKNRLSAYIERAGEPFNYGKAQSAPADFLASVRTGKLELNKGYQQPQAATSVLTMTPEVRFTAELDDDSIGGFSRSSMTPGKQALFALTLILNESQEPWPLLIDQPEDDLDSRSIYLAIVPYLVERKRERQIIMVSHNANLVIGADSEEVIVANRHGVDRPNNDGRTFEYLTGSLEHSQPLNEKSKTVLGRFGIREHACEILDGGEEAFQKRKEKYKI